METLLQDLRYSARMLIKNPGFTLIAVLTLSLGIGATTAIFSVVNAVLLRPLPYREPGQLVRVYSEFPTMNLRKFAVSPPEFMDLRNEASRGRRSAAGRWAGRIWRPGASRSASPPPPSRAGSSRRSACSRRSDAISPRKRIRPGGPTLRHYFDGSGSELSGASPTSSGRQIEDRRAPYTVVGVMPPGFVFPPGSNDQAEVWAPFQLDPADPGPAPAILSVIGRLKPGMTLEQARSRVSTPRTELAEREPPQHLPNRDAATRSHVFAP